MEYPHMLMLAVAGIAAFTDTRTGLIPNWLTFPAILAGPLYYLIWSSANAGLTALWAVFLVGLVPYAMYRMQSLGAGDVKLFAALGGLGGFTMGFELLMYSMLAAVAIALITMGIQGHLIVILKNVGRMLSNPFLPKKHRKAAERSQMHQLRLGLSIFVGTAVALGYQYAVV